MISYPSFLAREPAGTRFALRWNVTLFASLVAFVSIGCAALPAGWSTQDITPNPSNPPAAGSASESGGTFTVAGSGDDIYGTDDEFRFVYQAANGDFTFTARVASEQPIHVWSKAGIMFRETLQPTSKYVYLAIAPDSTNDKGMVFEYRTGDGVAAIQNINFVGPPVPIPPKWLRLVRSGNTFSAYRSDDGTSWSQVGTSATVTMSGNLYVGLAVCSAVRTTTCTATFTNVTPLVGNAYNPAFPRLGMYAIGNPQGYPHRDRGPLSKFNVVVIGGNWESWANGRHDPDLNTSYTRNDIVNEIHQLSPVGTKVLQYVNFNESPFTENINDNNPSSPEPFFPTWATQLDNAHWWLYNLGASGARPTSTFSQWYGLTNMTSDAGTSGGLAPYEWAAKFTYDLFLNSTDGLYAAGMAAPSLDGVYLDNVLWSPRRPGDWNRNQQIDAAESQITSTPTVQNEVTLKSRQGEKQFFDKLRTSTLAPTKILAGNTADAPLSDHNNQTDITQYNPLPGVMQGGLMEPAIGRANAPEQVSFARLMKEYKFQMDILSPPKLLIFQQRTKADGSDAYYNSSGVLLAGSPTPWRPMRYGLAACLMKDGYYMPGTDNAGTDTQEYNSNGSPKYQLISQKWYDEFSVVNGVAQAWTSPNLNAGLGYLGQPVAGANGAPQTAARWSNGVWAREFTHGIVLLNPKGNLQKTITPTELPGNWKRILGTQDPGTNNGHTLTASEPVVLADRDGIILLRGP
ncbi:MAG TPA: hypothetical protein VFT72_13210 [Opitutaceae bacterium]|nr:hypothetical protein [Opitutaceae bacterium]